MLKKEIESVIEKVQGELRSNQEWKSRYKEYIRIINDKVSKDFFKYAQKKFRVPSPLQLYMPLSTIKNRCNDNRIEFDIRFRGQSVATLRVEKDNGNEKVILIAKNSDAVKNALKGAGLTNEANCFSEIADNEIAWNDDAAEKFREIYSLLEKKISQKVCELKRQPEHAMESYLLKNYATAKGNGKEIKYIQPVNMKGTRAKFQMPTPIKASNVKKGVDTIEYSKSYGGGIDILARKGSGITATLLVMELKDENKDSESPDKVICQAVAYATFIRELLRSESGNEWWEFFGFSGNVPQELTIKAVVVMPLKNKKGEVSTKTSEFMEYVKNLKDNNKSFKISNTNDKIKLGYVFREDEKKSLSIL